MRLQDDKLKWEAGRLFSTFLLSVLTHAVKRH